MKQITLITILICSLNLLFAQSVPYNVNKRKFPLGNEFDKLLPSKLGGNWSRFAFHDFIPGLGSGKVYYRKDNTNQEVFLLFGKAEDQEDMKMIWQKLYDDASDGKLNQIIQKNTASKTLKYVLLNGTSGYYFLWTRNLFYFRLEAKNKSIADEFMKVFPY